MASTRERQTLEGTVSPNARGDVTVVDHRVYVDEGIYRLELEKVFGRLWVFVGLEIEVANPGDYKTTDIGETPVVVVRDADGTLRVFENVCIHRGAKLVRKPCGNAGSFTCMYHQWTYALDGRLQGVPIAARYPDTFNKDDYRLSQLARVETFAA